MDKYGSCTYCGEITELFFGLCSDCYQEEKSSLHAIREFLKQHPGSNAVDIATHTSIPITQITRLIKNGALK